MIHRAWFGIVHVGLIVGMLVGGFGGCSDPVRNYDRTCDDENPCTVDKCDANGNSLHTPVPNSDKAQCSLGGNNGVCLDGTCELTCKTQMTPCKCSSNTDCPMDTPCATWACTMGECVSTPMMEGMTVDPLQPGDCQKTVCQGGNVVTVADAIDTPADLPGDCEKAFCNGETPETMPDGMDFPAPTKCNVYSCGPDGAIVQANAPTGTKCGPNMDMACDSSGMCTGCLPKPDWDNCNMNSMPNPCPVKLCVGETSISASDCQSGFLADGVCCENACTDECKSCAVPGMVGTCTNIPYYEADLAYIDQFMASAKCDVASRCNGMGKCLKVIGKGCSLDAECISGVCSVPAQVCLGAPNEPCSSNAQCASGTCITFLMRCK